jgi:hypothetical protein
MSLTFCREDKEGSSPVKLLPDKSRDSRFLKLPIQEGIVPTSKLALKLIAETKFNLCRESGRLPESTLWLKSKFLKRPQSPKSAGKGPEKLLLLR